MIGMYDVDTDSKPVKAPDYRLGLPFPDRQSEPEFRILTEDLLSLIAQILLFGRRNLVRYNIVQVEVPRNKTLLSVVHPKRTPRLLGSI
jgi:hypothetical protein